MNKNKNKINSVNGDSCTHENLQKRVLRSLQFVDLKQRDILL